MQYKSQYYKLVNFMKLFILNFRSFLIKIDYSAYIYIGKFLYFHIG